MAVGFKPRNNVRPYDATRPESRLEHRFSDVCVLASVEVDSGPEHVQAGVNRADEQGGENQRGEEERREPCAELAHDFPMADQGKQAGYHGQGDYRHHGLFVEVLAIESGDPPTSLSRSWWGYGTRSPPGMPRYSAPRRGSSGSRRPPRRRHRAPGSRARARPTSWHGPAARASCRRSARGSAPRRASATGRAISRSRRTCNSRSWWR